MKFTTAVELDVLYMRTLQAVWLNIEKFSVPHIRRVINCIKIACSYQTTTCSSHS